jgi:hypothetical protein
MALMKTLKIFFDFAGVTVALVGMLLLMRGAEYLAGQTRKTQVAPDQIKAPRFAALACVAPGTANSNCAGLVYIDAVTPAGTEIKLIGAPPTAGFTFDPAGWNLIP